MSSSTCPVPAWACSCGRGSCCAPLTGVPVFFIIFFIIFVFIFYRHFHFCFPVGTPCSSFLLLLQSSLHLTLQTPHITTLNPSQHNPKSPTGLPFASNSPSPAPSSPATCIQDNELPCHVTCKRSNTRIPSFISLGLHDSHAPPPTLPPPLHCLKE